MALSVRARGLIVHLYVTGASGIEQEATLHLEPSGFLACSIPAGENARELAALAVPLLEQATARVREWGAMGQASTEGGTD
jgi:hypothetical protein